MELFKNHFDLPQEFLLTQPLHRNQHWAGSTTFSKNLLSLCWSLPVLFLRYLLILGHKVKPYHPLDPLAFLATIMALHYRKQSTNDFATSNQVQLPYFRFLNQGLVLVLVLVAFDHNLHLLYSYPYAFFAIEVLYTYLVHQLITPLKQYQLSGHYSHHHLQNHHQKLQVH